ncbi:kinase-like protein [Hypoxylon sp. NC1633]|nr:kinase-like protein [Hypoxylon sp. NC1633]
MPARFPDKTMATQPQGPDPPPSCQQLVKKAGSRQVWALGSRYVLKDRVYYPGSEIEVRNSDFAADRISGYPFPSIAHSWREGDRFFIMQARLDGVPLEEALPRLSQQDLQRIGHQVGQYLLQLRRYHSPQTHMLDGRPVVDRRLFKPLDSNLAGNNYSVCTTDDELRNNLSRAIASRLDNSTLNNFMSMMPSAMPFTFSHSDVHEGNIIVKQGMFVGLIDWELAGYYPRWWEYVNSCELLSDYLPAPLREPQALAWFRVYHAIREGTENWHQTLRFYLVTPRF